MKTEEKLQAPGRLHRVVGAPAPRADGVEKVTGQARYTADLHLPGMLFGKVLRSPLPHARITAIDASEALRTPGVVAVLTGDDLADLDAYYGHAVKDRPVIALGKVRHVGDPVAAVAAETEAIASDALERIDVSYEELPAATDIASALAPGAPAIHDAHRAAGDFHDLPGVGEASGRNICYHLHEELGDVEAAFAQADHVFEDEFRFPSVYHYALEPHTVLAEWAGGRLRVWSSTQHPFIVRADLAAVFRLPLHRVAVISPYIGGGFGSKSYTKFEPLVAALARKAGRPVLVEFSVEEAFLTNRRHAARIRIGTAVSADGRILGRRVWAYFDTGAYADNGPRVAAQGGIRALGIYRAPAHSIDSYAVYTNTPPAGSFRAIGAPQAAWACESQMDMIAQRLGLDPLEFRLRNALRRGERLRPDRTPIDGDLPGDLRLLAERAGTPPAPDSVSPPPGAGDGPSEAAPLRGAGIAASMTGAGAGPVATAVLRLLADGTVLLQAGAAEMGQGARTVLAQIAAEELSLPVERVRVGELDSDAVPFNRSTGASRSTTVVGTAVVAAAADLKAQVFQIAAPLLESAAADLDLADGCVVAPSGRRLPLERVVQTRFGMRGGEIIGRGYSGPGLHGGRLDGNPVFWEVAMGHAEITVDPETGVIAVDRYVSLADVGLAVNPRLLEGQELGAAIQGFGHTLFEEVVLENGQVLNPNLIDYRVPTFADLPRRFESLLVENGDGPGPYGVKGAGEGALVPVAAAVGNALYSAAGVRITELPLTPERVWRALAQRRNRKR